MYKDFKNKELNEFSSRVDAAICLINKNTKKAQAEALLYKVNSDKYNVKVGEVCYDFNIEITPRIYELINSPDINQIFHRDKRKTVIDNFLSSMAHFQCSLFIDEHKVIIKRSNRNIWIRPWNFSSISEYEHYICICKERQQIDWDNASFYISAVTRQMFISDAKEDVRDIESYAIIPYSDMVSLEELKGKAKLHKDMYMRTSIPSTPAINVIMMIIQSHHKEELSYEYVAELADYDVTTIKKNLNELEKYGYIKIHKSTIKNGVFCAELLKDVEVDDSRAMTIRLKV